jgi:hypothetical protein
VEPFTVSVKEPEAVSFGEDESDTCTLKLNWPDLPGVPESDPADCNVIPEGSAPLVSVQL